MSIPKAFFIVALLAIGIPADAQELIPFHWAKDNTIHVDAKVDGKAAILQLDTGATHTLLHDGGHAGASQTIVSTAGGKAVAYSGSAEIRIGNRKTDATVIYVNQKLSSDVAGLLGMSTLKTLCPNHLIIHFKRGVLECD